MAKNKEERKRLKAAKRLAKEAKRLAKKAGKQIAAIISEKKISFKDLPLHIRMNVEDAPKKEQDKFMSNF